MKKLLVAINAKFIHSNLAIRSIQKYGQQQGQKIDWVEYTINQSVDDILDGIIKKHADIVGFSCYIWNIEIIRKLVGMLNQITPKTKVVLGGPEISYESTLFLEKEKGIDYIVRGEGERSTIQLFQAIEENKPIDQVAGITYRDQAIIKTTQQGKPLRMDELPFVYEKNLDEMNHRLIYYETSRGCPYNCEYCLSSIEKGVRFRSLNKVYKELQFFLDQQIKQVKFVDRTFNARKSHAMGIWTYLRDHDNGITNFHFELVADQLDDEMMTLLATLRVGLVQFEIGVQSTNMATIVDINRATNFSGLEKWVWQIKKSGNIHLHLDLIAGLPREDKKTFEHSFNDVMTMRPEKLQLGFLKVLKGSMMYKKQKEYGLIYRKFPPYEIISTKEMTYTTISGLKQVEKILELYYNSGQFTESIIYGMSLFESDFEFFDYFSKYWEKEGLLTFKHARLSLYEVFYRFVQEVAKEKVSFLKVLLIHDFCSKEKPKKLPFFMRKNTLLQREMKEFYQLPENRIKYFQDYGIYDSKQIGRMTHIQAYEYDIMDWIRTRKEPKKGEATYLLYTYKVRDSMSGLATIKEIEL